MTKTEEILEKHLKIMDAETMIGKHGRTHKAIINALNEAINYTGCCELLKCKKELTFDEWCNINKYRKTKNGKYVDTQDLWFTEKALLKIYNLD